VQGDEVRARIQSAQPLDEATVRMQSSLRIYLTDIAPLASLQKRLDQRGEGEVTLVIRLREGGEAEIRLPGRFKVTPQIAGAIKAVPGVIQVEAA
jgi:DNA polymerase-3 subunit alpha